MAPWVMLALVTLAHALGSFSALAVAPLAPFLVDALHLTRAQVGLFLPAAYLGGVVMSLPAGWVTDRVGVRTSLAGGLALIGVMVALAARADGLWGVLGCLVVAGFGFSVLNPATGRAVLEWFPPRRRGVAMGIKQTGLTLGGVASALVLPPLAASADWRHALGAAGLTSVACGFLVATAYRSVRVESASAALDPGRLREAVGFLRRPGVLVVMTCGLALSMTQSALLAYLTLYGREVLELSAVQAGRLLALAQIGGAAGRLAWGVVSDRVFESRRRPGIVVSATLAVVTFALLAIGGSLPGAFVALLALAAGTAAFGWVGLYLTLVAELGGARYAGLLTGLAVVFSWSGVLVGPPLFGALLQGSGRWETPWLVFAVLSLIVAFVLPRPRPLVQRTFHV
ncbi:MAG TPA: MFS transporter [Methylomirabilota bacterium]|jgi:sugar phosphate permease|nr:MFS transporter [Methylomirabilota bacterium]